MKAAIIIFLVFLFLMGVSALIGLGVKKKEKELKKEFAQAQTRIHASKKAYRGSKKRYGKVPKIIPIRKNS